MRGSLLKDKRLLLTVGLRMVICLTQALKNHNLSHAQLAHRTSKVQVRVIHVLAVSLNVLL
jgi:hypothetical protein